MDLAGTSGLRNDQIVRPTSTNRYATKAYAYHYIYTLNVDMVCMTNDIKYDPMIVEGSGVLGV